MYVNRIDLIFMLLKSAALGALLVLLWVFISVAIEEKRQERKSRKRKHNGRKKRMV